MNNESTSLRVTVGDPQGTTISPILWGIFLEDLNSAIDGGLNAERVQNGDFEYTPQDRPEWGPLTAWTVEGEVDIRSQDPIHARSSAHAHLDARQHSASLTNVGFGAMVLPPGGYLLRLAHRSLPTPPASGPLRVEILDGDHVVAGTELPPASSTWEFAQARLDIPDDIRDGRLRLVLDHGALDIDCVSLRPIDPDTDAPRDFRSDLVDALRQLRPRFLRFPGGCVAHGLGLDNAYHWKHTVGPRHERRQMPNLWGYHQSMAIGYMEYFELCEELGATPVPIVAAGVCCQNLPGGPEAIPQEDMPAYIQDLVELIEFATADTSTHWGSLRAQWGHPEPFDLRFLGVGNEDTITDDFRERFAAIQDVLAATHPEITVIGTTGPALFGTDYERGWAFARERDVPMVDEHSYRSAHWWLQNLDFYDRYDREGPTVYLGEYAAKTSRLRSALAEAALMISLERNADVVKMASYAPLLAKQGSTQWIPDLIYFTDEDISLSSSYHVQRMFAEADGATVCPVELDSAQPLTLARPLPTQRSIRLASAGATVHWTGIRLDGVAQPETRTADDGAVHTLGRWTGTTLELEALVEREAGTEGFRVECGGERGESFFSVVIGSWQNKSTLIARSDDGIPNEIDGPEPYAGVATGKPLRLRVLIDGGEPAHRIRVWIDGELIHDVLDNGAPEEVVVAGAITTTNGGRVVRLVNATPTPRRAHVGLGVPGSRELRQEVLTGADPDDGEPFESWPAPESSTRQIAEDGSVETDLPAWSFTVLTTM